MDLTDVAVVFLQGGTRSNSRRAGRQGGVRLLWQAQPFEQVGSAPRPVRASMRRSRSQRWSRRELTKEADLTLPAGACPRRSVPVLKPSTLTTVQVAILFAKEGDGAGLDGLVVAGDPGGRAERRSTAWLTMGAKGPTPRR
jgi:hypothetical protein